MNIYDIAKEAGVSISTVSRVLNNKGNVNEQTRKKVEEVLKKNNYTPSAIARGMVSKSMRTIAVLTVDIRVPHYATTAYIIERECSKKGYEVLMNPYYFLLRQMGDDFKDLIVKIEKANDLLHRYKEENP